MSFTLKDIHVILGKPKAFENRNDLEYIYIELECVEFYRWGTHRITSTFQIPKGERNMSKIFWDYFKEIIKITHTKPLKISMEIEEYHKSEFKFIGGASSDKDNITWSREKYREILNRKILKDKKEKKNERRTK